ncbi:MAG: hypothetical protein ABIO02_05170 [Patescibacteria group bacterium]
MVVDVLMISCQVSENLRIGPDSPHRIRAEIAIMKAQGVPIASAVFPAILVNILFMKQLYQKNSNVRL